MVAVDWTKNFQCDTDWVIPQPTSLDGGVGVRGLTDKRGTVEGTRQGRLNPGVFENTKELIDGYTGVVGWR